jgi:hypothetical protein
LFATQPEDESSWDRMNARYPSTVRNDEKDETQGLTYRAELRRRSSLGTSTYYEAGDCCGYTFDMLIETVVAESRLSYDSLVLNLEIVGACPETSLAAISRRFSRLTGPKVSVIVRHGRHTSMLEKLRPRASAPDARTSS